MTPEERSLLVETFIKVLGSKDYDVFLFGSRMDGTAKPGSDLDILLKGLGPVPFEKMAFLREAFENSTLPYHVDLHDFHTVPAYFWENIKEDVVPLNILPKHPNASPRHKRNGSTHMGKKQ